MTQRQNCVLTNQRAKSAASIKCPHLTVLQIVLTSLFTYSPNEKFLEFSYVCFLCLSGRAAQFEYQLQSQFWLPIIK